MAVSDYYLSHLQTVEANLHVSTEKIESEKKSLDDLCRWANLQELVQQSIAVRNTKDELSSRLKSFADIGVGSNNMAEFEEFLAAYQQNMNDVDQLEAQARIFQAELDRLYGSDEAA